MSLSFIKAHYFEAHIKLFFFANYHRINQSQGNHGPKSVPQSSEIGAKDSDDRLLEVHYLVPLHLVALKRGEVANLTRVLRRQMLVYVRFMGGCFIWTF